MGSQIHIELNINFIMEDVAKTFDKCNGIGGGETYGTNMEHCMSV